MTTVLAFLVTLGVLIVVHEWGHYRAARACGVKVLRFSVGFGRPLLRWQRGETEFVVSALPLGGYVKMLDEREGEVDAHDAPRAFNRQSLSRRAFIVVAGPLANLVLAVLLFAATFWIGIDEPRSLLGAPMAGSLAEDAGFRSGDWVREVATQDAGIAAGASALAEPNWRPIETYAELRWSLTEAALAGQTLRLRVTDAAGAHRRELDLALAGVAARDVDGQLLKRIGLGGPLGEPVIGRVIDGGPAARAGLKEGDRVSAVDGVAVDDAATLRERIRGAVGEQGQPLPLRLLVQRAPDAQPIEIELLPNVQSDVSPRVARIEAFVGTPAAIVKVRHGVFEGLHKGAVRTWEVASLSLRMLGRMLIGEASLKNLSGPLTIADYAGQSAQLGVAYYLGFLALVSVSLGVLNLLPLPMLDGGHLMYYLFEAVTGRPVSEQWLERLQRGGLAIMVLLMSLALYNDFARLFGLH